MKVAIFNVITDMLMRLNICLSSSFSCQLLQNCLGLLEEKSVFFFLNNSRSLIVFIYQSYMFKNKCSDLR